MVSYQPNTIAWKFHDVVRMKLEAWIWYSPEMLLASLAVPAY